MNEHEPTCGANTMCLVYHGDGMQCRGECTCGKSVAIEITNVDRRSPECPLTNSSHEKSLVRVVDKHVLENTPERACSMHVSFIQVLCVCGHIISEAEIKSK